MYSKKQLKLYDYKVLGKLPNPFLFDNGELVKSLEDWNLRREEIYRTAVELQFGTIPPIPDYTEVELLSEGKQKRNYKIYCGRQDKCISFLLKLILPQQRNCPIIIDGDLGSNYYMQPGFIDTALESGIGWAYFDRTELAHDVKEEGRGHGALYQLYPEYTFGAIGAWAWAFCRCVDVLEKLMLQEIDLKWIVACGHSRGGKAAILAGAIDERFKVINPNEACLGGGGCYRFYSIGDYPGLDRWPSETLKDIWAETGFWFGPELGQYVNHEEALPFDAHFLKAMVAPRILVVSEAGGDMWANPVGSWHTTIAAKEVYQFMGVPDNLLWYYRDGTHFHKSEDIQMLVNAIKHCRDGTLLSDSFFKRPFMQYEKIYDWEAPIITN